MSTSETTALVIPFEQLRMTDVETVGGKNASLGEMISQLAASGVRVPGGFATTAQAFREFLAHSGLTDKINARLASLNTDDVRALAEAEEDALAEAVGAALGLADALAPPSAVGSLPSVVSLVSLAAAASPSMIRRPAM